MGLLTQVEDAMEHWEHTLVNRVFRSDPVRLVDALRRECDDHAVVCSEHRILVPNAYDIELARYVHQELAGRDGHVGRALTDALARHAAEQGYEWAGPLTVHVAETRHHLANGRYRITSQALPHIGPDAFDAPA
ncbi:DUF3662 domain-containing protein [Streptomyces purpurogeneiscleroticus]|uniref:DUF3662 domain-containing protein n=1 Tax=Streptomyces purpurogeneiscleroticus TaxID=68259 RepID=UPI001CBBB2FD|nr:DUF3662 domain-containing protein [Streptomyces purpurogeneiscleroticus]MBZ4017624.1 forkhead-associated protein [Streptomyces purpurogeneiscleroticus]